MRARRTDDKQGVFWLQPGLLHFGKHRPHAKGAPASRQIGLHQPQLETPAGVGGQQCGIKQQGIEPVLAFGQHEHAAMRQRVLQHGVRPDCIKQAVAPEHGHGRSDGHGADAFGQIVHTQTVALKVQRQGFQAPGGQLRAHGLLGLTEQRAQHLPGVAQAL